MTETNYYFNDESPFREYAGSSLANPGSLPPANASRTAPNESEGFWPVWNGSGWELMEDHRGEKGWLSGQEFEIKDLGPLPEGWSWEQPPPSPEELKAQALARLQGLLVHIDSASIRPLRAVADGTATQFDTDKLAGLNEKAAEIRGYVSHPEDVAEEMFNMWEVSI
jgi:hypothetical protein